MNIYLTLIYRHCQLSTHSFTSFSEKFVPNLLIGFHITLDLQTECTLFSTPLGSLLCDVQTGMSILPVKSYDSRKVQIIRDASDHQSGVATTIVSYWLISSFSPSISGLALSSFCSYITLLLLLL